MSRELVTVEYEGTIDDALARMVEKGQNTVMVMDQRVLVGLIGDVDIGRLAAKGVDIKKAWIRDFVTACILTGNQPCVQIRQDETVVNALKVMDSWGAAQIVVVDEDNKVVGYAIGTGRAEGLERRGEKRVRERREGLCCDLH